VDQDSALGRRIVHGPFEVDSGRQRIMRSASGFEPHAAPQIREAALCGSCHTLYTEAFNAEGEEVGLLPEQMPYLEWLHSAYNGERTCQDCHMPVVGGEAAITGVFGQPRAPVARHVFRGGNFLIPRILNRYRNELGVQALPQELEAAANLAVEHLRTSTASVTIGNAVLDSGRLAFAVAVENLAGHKLPTAYPSRRVWLHVTVSDARGTVLFESGEPRADGSIAGNDNDADAHRYEPHYAEIHDAEQVEIYEAIMEHYDGGPTTGLLNGVGYLKDNRLLPRGFDKRTADHDVAVSGAAMADEDFTGGSDRVRYAIDMRADGGPLTIAAQLLYQPVAYRWARNLAEYEAFEPQRFVRYYDGFRGATYQELARAKLVVR